MKINLAALPQDEMDKVNVDLAAAGVAFKERYNMPIVAEVVEREQPAHLRDWFRALYQTLLGSDQGPRMGSFIALYGIENSRKLIAEALGQGDR